MHTKSYRHIAYGLRKDGSLGREEPQNPVAEALIIPIITAKESDPCVFAWSDGTVGQMVVKDNGGGTSIVNPAQHTTGSVSS